MAATNDITGEALQTKAASQAYLDNYDAIFRNVKSVTVDELIDDLCKDDPELREQIAEEAKTINAEDHLGCFVRVEPNPDWPEEAESRMEQIGQNGNDGLIYEERPDLYPAQCSNDQSQS